MVRGFGALGHSVRVVACLEHDHRGVHGRLDVPIAMSGVPRHPRGWMVERREARAANWVAREALRGPAADLIYERWSLFSQAGAALRRAWGVPWVLEVNAPLVQERERFERLYDARYARRWQQRVLEQPDALVAVSAWLCRWLVGQGIPASKVHHVPNGADPQVGNRLAGRALLGLKHGHLAVGFLGSCKLWHGVDQVPEIARRAGGVPVILGDGPVRIQGAHGRVPEDQVADAVAALDVGLAPYPEHAPPWFHPLKIEAYRAQGVPTVASDVGELAQIVGAHGRVVPAGDLDAFGRACREVQRFEPSPRSWAHVASQVLEIAGAGARG
jgi:glycosyltransferase involved in cell wall biosynthesis